MAARYAIGIDLGTTNGVVSFVELDAEAPEVQVLGVPQVVAPGVLETREALPSFLYLAPEGETNQGSYDLPWGDPGSEIVGELARRNSAEVPDRTIGAAKSWLSYERVDRRQAILPWQAPEDVQKLSPVTASQRYLEHLVAACDHAHPDEPLSQQVVVLTVPASFDASARDLTREAAIAAGLPSDHILLEEPQAAVYSWLQSEGDQWRKKMSAGDTLLVCDVGGGTTDLTLIQAVDRDGNLELERLAVGNHLLVGGDNMDLALAYHVAAQFGEKGVDLDPWQTISLWHSCRAAKEELLGGTRKQKIPISVKKRGSKLIGGTVSIDIEKDSAEQLLLDGFFPKCDASTHPQPNMASGFQELGLPYEADTGITKHLAAFLDSQGSDDSSNQPIHPTHLLFNGGVFKSTIFRERVREVVESWDAKQSLTILDSEVGLDNAVARGAAFYGWSKQHGSVRIRGGSARSYYVGIQTAGLAIPGAPRPLKALCVVPIGMEEGTERDVPSREIGLVVGQPAKFRFFSSNSRRDDQPGDMLERWTEEELSETAPMETVLNTDQELKEPFLPVKFLSKVTELGMLELWCVSQKSEDRWKLEFSIREEG